MLSTSTSTIRSYAHSSRLHAEACEVLAGGVNSNFRLGGQPVPLVFERAAGSRLYDVDGNSYVDYALGMGPNILGHAPEPVIRAVANSLAQGQLFAGGWFDTILVSVAPPLDQAGPEDAPRPHLPSAGQSAVAAGDVAVLPWNNLAAVRRYLEAHARETAALIMEPILCNTSVVVPRAGYLEGVRALCDQYGVVLIFDEVITGFRVALSGAQGRLGVTPDLSVFAKALAGGFPIGAVVGKRPIMELIGNGSVLHGGSFNGHTASIAAGLATLAELSREGVYEQMEARGEALMDGLRQVARQAGLPFLVQGLGTAFNTAFTDQPSVTDYRAYVRCDLDKQKRFLHALQNEGVRPTSRGTWFMSTAHTDADIEETVRAAERALPAM